MIQVFTLLLKQITGQREQPNVQQQQTQPQNNHLTLTGNVFFSTLFILRTVALNSSGATRDIRPFGNSDSKRLLSPNLKQTVANTCTFTNTSRRIRIQAEEYYYPFPCTCSRKEVMKKKKKLHYKHQSSLRNLVTLRVGMYF